MSRLVYLDFVENSKWSPLALGYSKHPTLYRAVRAAVRRTVRTWRYARSIGVDPTIWWEVCDRETGVCLASVGPLPGAEARARQIIDKLGLGA